MLLEHSRSAKKRMQQAIDREGLDLVPKQDRRTIKQAKCYCMKCRNCKQRQAQRIRRAAAKGIDLNAPAE